MTREEYLLLFEKYLAGKATPQEIEDILTHHDDFELLEEDVLNDQPEYEEAEERILNRLNSNIQADRFKKNNTKFYWLAASVTLFIAFACLYFIKGNNSQTNFVNNTVARAKPKSENALLTLANGKKIVLNEIKTGSTLKAGNIQLKKEAGGLMQVSIIAATQAKPIGSEINLISTPIGEQFDVVLPDGSKVFLNSASTLKFPTVFTGGERKVELAGEAYFEVAKNRKLPFKVKYGNNIVEVLGTHFNIMAYANEAASATTLLEGSVRISNDQVKRILIPGQQAVSNTVKSTIDVLPADIEQTMAWKNNVFLFRNENITHIMRQLARWYNIDVIYQVNTEHKDYGIRMSKSKKLSEILKNLELTGTIHFKVDGRRVTVME